MRASDLLTDLSARDIHVVADGDRLRCNAPAGALTPELRDELRARKNEILEFLRSADTLARQQRAIVPLQPRGELPPIFAVAGHNGDVFCYRALAQHLGDSQPFYGLQPPGVDGQSEPLQRVQDLAQHFAEQIRAFQPEGPCIIVGYCAGGTVAFELAQQLRRQGGAVNLLALFGSPYATFYRPLSQLRWRFLLRAASAVNRARVLVSQSWDERRSYFAARLRRLGTRSKIEQTEMEPLMVARRGLERATVEAISRYSPEHFPGRVALFMPNRRYLRSGTAPRGWRSVARNAEEYFGPEACESDTMLLEPFAPAFAELFARHREKTGLDAPDSPQRTASTVPAGEGLDQVGT